MRQPERAPERADIDALLTASTRPTATRGRGLGHSGRRRPGRSRNLLTLRAVRALQSADVILFDDLVSPEMLDFARREAKKMLVGKTGHGPSCKQDEINALMVKLAKPASAWCG